MKRITGIFSVVLFAAMAAGQELPAQPAALTPAEVGLYIEINDLKTIRAELENDPLATFVRRQLPLARQPHAWRGLQHLLGMSGEEIVNRYFGESMAILSRSSKGGPSSMLLTRVTPEDQQHAIEKLKLRPTGETAGFATYKNADGNTNFAFRSGWMAVAGEGAGADFGKAVLTRIDGAKSLAQDEAYQKWRQRVAEKSPHALLFARDAEKDEAHMLAAAGAKRALRLKYAGQSADLDEMLSKVGDAGALDFGPLPASAVAAATLNLHRTSMEERETALLDRLVAPKKFTADVLPNLAAPIVLFAAPVSGGESGGTLPALGVSIRLKSPEAAADLDRIMDGLVLLANLQTMSWKTDPIGVTAGQSGGASYRTADFGTPLAQRMQNPAMRPAARLTFGRVGEYYVITTHDELFAACAQAAADPAKRMQPAALTAGALKAMEQPIASAFVRAAESAALIRGASTLLTANVASDTDADRAHKLTQLGKVMEFAASVLDYYEGGTIQFSRGDGRSVLGTAQLIRSVERGTTQ